MSNFVKVLPASPMVFVFVGARVLMILAGIVRPNVEIRPLVTERRRS